jgi:hypothetical protein
MPTMDMRKRLKKTEGPNDRWVQSKVPIRNTLEDRQKRSIQKKTRDASLPADAESRITRPVARDNQVHRNNRNTLNALTSKKTKKKNLYIA